MAHELGHALGLFHEHQRPDRDDYISVVRDNIKTGQESNFSPVNPNYIEYLDVPYDLSSDMHYRAAVSIHFSNILGHLYQFIHDTIWGFRKFVSSRQMLVICLICPICQSTWMNAFIRLVDLLGHVYKYDPLKHAQMLNMSNK